MGNCSGDTYLRRGDDRYKTVPGSIAFGPDVPLEDRAGIKQDLGTQLDENSWIRQFLEGRWGGTPLECFCSGPVSGWVGTMVFVKKTWHQEPHLTHLTVELRFLWRRGVIWTTFATAHIFNDWSENLANVRSGTQTASRDYHWRAQGSNEYIVYDGRWGVPRPHNIPWPPMGPRPSYAAMGVVAQCLTTRH
ncbi:hypothetical protein BDW02DRAFT_596029 [Decorospora gaudefroyi]|uniref:Uncharacterized protein n=1 Tax=Decorospora gaudefroyi TaxID=184978 RepID=A0A6A5KL75_9PLEO|nr:hypothetical protein BDW02DRAFT_596029 [Decorospora gaudefroyi]